MAPEVGSRLNWKSPHPALPRATLPASGEG